MATNKNQHFVPRCYLRSFAADADRKTINLFNLDRQRLIIGAPIKSQCSRDYFYGQDPLLEDAIQHVEGGYSAVLPDLLTFKCPPSPGALVVLPRFWLLQHIRTEAASARMVAMSVETDALIEHPTESFKLGIKQAVLIALRAYADMLGVLDDLKLVLAYNRTKTPFVCSDDPAVMINRWTLSSAPFSPRSFGLHSAGLVCVLPLSPKVCCLLYDGDIYSIAHTSNWIEVRSESDIDALNELQYLNCAANLYFHDAGSENTLMGIHKRVAELRIGIRHRINYAVKEESSDGLTRYRVVNPNDAPKHCSALIHSQVLRTVPRAWPSFLRWRPRGTYYSNGAAFGQARFAHSTTPIDSRPMIKFRTGH